MLFLQEMDVGWLDLGRGTDSFEMQHGPHVGTRGANGVDMGCLRGCVWIWWWEGDLILNEIDRLYRPLVRALGSFLRRAPRAPGSRAWG